MSIGDIGCDLAIMAAFGIYWLLDQFFNEGSITDPEKQVVPKSEKSAQQLRTCHFEGCYSLPYRSTEYCWKHQDGQPHDTDRFSKPNWWEEGGGAP
ncbi:MAG: hypothetical protein QGF28_00215 [Candidatus Thalassarchaeaceae archaeon]|nr:hypothetical protein [Candidatus Thalassarchaeaceae archaeon]MDP7445618.1 hypothetical protein [Candidatus Thalassarchaeaceae archaeon]MDP7648827.1 hypothetical protein [Candidatus Thalassarchaeaceae archaeon]HJL54490.1 hypothetical protein [Candidatus Thalassarchaeaceae archaeon]HJM77535.1 hypothetical protein [Candidatus Thalassarchaeaceae archaeon]